MVYPIVKLLTGQLSGTEIVDSLSNGGGVGLGATTGQIGNAPGPAGASTALLLRSGNINSQISAAGVQPGGTAADNVIANFVLPAGAFDVAGRSFTVSASGAFGATGNNKRIKVIVGATAAVVGSTITGGTTIADTGTVATNGGGWSISGKVTKYGAAGSNTQLASNSQVQAGAAVAALTAPAALTLTESGAINVSITGNATTAASDILLNLFQVFWNN